MILGTSTFTDTSKRNDFLVILGAILLHAIAVVVFIKWAKGFRP
jgi:hypothetical protein